MRVAHSVGAIPTVGAFGFYVNGGCECDCGNITVSAILEGCTLFSRSHSSLLLACTILSGVVLITTANAQSLTAYGKEPTGFWFVKLNQISADGYTVIGEADSAGYIIRNGEQNYLYDVYSELSDATATAVNADASVLAVKNIGGQSYLFDTNTRSMTDVTPDSGILTINALSADGSSFAGTIYDNGISRAQFGTASGDLYQLTIPDGFDRSSAVGISGYGNRVLATMYNSQLPYFTRSALWTGNSGPMLIDSLYEEYPDQATDISFDGSTVVGYAYGPNGVEAYQWTESGGTVGLGNIEGYSGSYANAVSNEGNVIVGNVTGSASPTAFIWTKESGSMQTLHDFVAEQGIDDTGWWFANATDISASGQTIIGKADFDNTSRDFILRLGEEVALTTPETAEQSLLSIGTTPLAAAHLTSEFLSSSIMMPEQDASAPGYSSAEPLAYASAPTPQFPDFAPAAPSWSAFTVGFGSASLEGTSASGLGLGVRGAIDQTVFVGGSLGYGTTYADTAYEGSTTLHGLFGTAFVGYGAESGLQVQAGASAGKLDVSIDRGYLNGNSQDHSFGETSGLSYSALLRVGYITQLMPSTALEPFAVLQATHAQFEGYTEQGGSMPAIVDSLFIDDYVAKIGIQLHQELGSNASLWSSATYNTRLDSSSTGVSAEILDMFGIDSEFEGGAATWTTFAVGASFELIDATRLNGSVSADVDQSGARALSGRVGLSASF